MKPASPSQIKSSSIAIALAYLAVACSPGSDSSKTDASTSQEIGPDHIEIVHKFDVGKRYVYEFDMAYETDFGAAFGGMMPKGQGATQTQEYAVSVIEETPSGGRLLEFTFQRNKFDMNMGGMKTSFDSNDPIDSKDPSSIMFEAFNKAIGQAIKVELDAKSEIVSVSGLDAIRDSIIESAPPQIAAMIDGTFSNLYIENLTVPTGLPLQQVKPGDSWPSNITQNLGVLGTMMADLQYQFKKMENHEGAECAQIAFSGTIRGRPNKEAEGETKQMMDITGGTTFGKQWYDPEIGQFTDSAVEQNMKMKVAVPGLPAEAMEGGGLTVEISQKVSRKLLRVESIGDPEPTEETAEQ
jgi:hypothetical protein